MRDLDVEPAFLTMLRHPAEVSASRHKSYMNADDPPTRDVQIRRVAGWINSVLTAESMTRGLPRVWLHYSDLLSDWRSALGRVSSQLDLSFDPPVGSAPHPVDEFIDPSLRSVHADRPELDLPVDLHDLGDEVWETMSVIAATRDSASSLAEADRLRASYRRLTDDAAALIYDGNNRRREQAKTRAHRQGLEEGRSAATVDEPPARRGLVQRMLRPNQ